MREINMGATWFEQPIHGPWTIADIYGRRSYPEEIHVHGKRFCRAKWREAKAGVVDQYREAVETNSQHLLVLSDGRWIIDHTDDVNPDMGDATAPARHFVADHPVGQGLLALGLFAGVCLVVAGIVGSIKS
jgi:hypothetical protein